MGSEVRWRLLVSYPGGDAWVSNSDYIYEGWFYGDASSEPSESVLASYKEAVETLTWLDVRLIQEVRSFTTKTLQETRREVSTESGAVPPPGGGL